MSVSGNRIIGGLLVLAVIAVCIATIPLSAYLGLLFLYIEPNPRHMPPDLMGEAVGWTIIGLMAGAIVVIISDTIVWQGPGGFWDKYKGLALGSGVGLIAGCTLGVVFAIIQMDSVDGQAMTSRQLAAMAGATAGTLGAIAGIITGAVARRYVITLSRLPSTEPVMMNHANGAGQAAASRSGHAGKYP